MERVDPQRLEAHVRMLCEDIGVRLAGTPGEERAADRIASSLAEAGAVVHQESFPVRSRLVTEERLELLTGGEWRRFPCSLFSSTPGTDGRTVEAPLVVFEAPAEGERRDLSDLRGKAVIHLGCHIESRDAYRRLIDADPAFLLFVDVRYPGDVPLADGMFPAYTRALGAVPTVNVAYQDAWQWCARGATRARLRVRGGMVPATSSNVVGELPGETEDAELILLGAHHDTQADSVGADDNASGVAGILELARVLAARPRRRAIRIVSFGAEEQLSVGSARYVRQHRDGLQRRGRLVFNLDSYGSWMGWTELVTNGPPELETHAGRAFRSRDCPVRVLGDIVPYADHFPFVAAGIPGITLFRSNCTAGRFFHHRVDDDPSRLSYRQMARLLDAAAAWLGDLADAEEIPFARSVPPAQAESIGRFWEDLFGGWDEPA